MAEFEVEVRVGQQDIRTHAEVAPELALTELIWNAFDADATEVKIITDRSVIDAPPDRLRVVDNGSGIPPANVRDLFGSSWGARGMSCVSSMTSAGSSLARSKVTTGCAMV